MILIKDRHDISNYVRLAPMTGKYDTYKGSTHRFAICSNHLLPMENMILIKDRHMTIVLVIWTSRAEGNMILIKDYVLGVICF